MDAFVRDRITQLRIKKSVSEYQMSYDLGHSRGYINNISSGKALPSLNEFFSICEYFNVTPKEFFDANLSDPALISKAIFEIKDLSENDILLILTLINRLKQNK